MYKVLIVEDEDMIRDGLKYMVDWLSLDCVVVGEAGNGVEGLEKIAELSPDIVLLDINMPLKTGIELLEDNNGKHIFSTIILSGYEDFAYAKRAIEFKVTEYLLKPVNHAELFEAVESAKESVTLIKQYQLIQNKVATLDKLNVLNLDVLNATNHKSIHVKQIIEYIQENYPQKISMDDLVDRLEMSATYINNKIKESTTYTFNELLNRYRIQKAIEIISVGDDKISTVALDVGFSNYRYFIKVFKRYTKSLPSDFLHYFRNQKE
ncbi:response regulator transcription factor [Bacillus sp. FSL K6-3431]|uniref:response regulator transcription factor n=1 Tax=Bacillus sp. FSL K6-3431 TaxID=2921500 RepID=UPI0030F6C042